ncbi:MAG: SDR family oxidoreductase [Hyphomicrobiales bacterium]|nr:SDR family oxidoreductase [Hyphomicrobiales bacterium]
MASDKVILVTGAGGGLGGAMALALAEAGHRVAAADVSMDRLEALIDRAGTQPGEIVPFQVNLADKGECQALVGQVVERCGDLFMLVNNAGVGQQIVDPDYSGNPKMFWDVDIDDWETVINVNTRAPLILTQAAVRHFLRQGRGRIVNVTTSFDTMLFSGVWAYGQSKAALEAASASLAGLLAETPVRLNILVPGGPANTGLLPANTRMDRAKIIQPPVMGPPIVWLASDEAAQFNNRRMIALQWDAALPGLEAAQRASAPCAWPGFGVQAAAPQ